MAKDINHQTGLHPDCPRLLRGTRAAQSRPKYFSQRGLDPKLLPLIVQKAKIAGLWVAAHIWSAADVHVAVSAGVHQIAHMPGFWLRDEEIANENFENRSFARYRISEADARGPGPEL